jgi:hypothetical protein
MPAQNPMECPHWDGLTVKDFVEWMGVSDDLHKTLHLLESYNIEAIDVWIDGVWIGPDDPTDRITDDSAIQKLRVRGIAWDGSDWEWGEEISGNDSPNIVIGNLADSRGRFREALCEHEYAQAEVESQMQMAKLNAVDSLLDSLRELLEICRYKCSPLDEIILPSGKTNEQAMIDAMAAIDNAEIKL